MTQESLLAQLKLCSEITDRNMALMDQIREEREQMAGIVKLFGIVLNQTSVQLLQQDILKTVEEQERREKARMPGGVPLRLLK